MKKLFFLLILALFAASDCVLKIHVLEPEGWLHYSSDDEIAIRFLVFNISADDNVSTAGGSPITPLAQHTSVRLQNGTSFLPAPTPQGDEYQLGLAFSDKAEGIKNYTIFANASGCENASKTINYYLTKKFVIEPSLPEYDFLLIPLVAAIALLAMRRKNPGTAG